MDLKCKKNRSGGACALQGPKSPPVIICPNRLYAKDFAVIKRVAEEAFGPLCELITDEEAEKRRRKKNLTGNEIVVFGQGYSGEVGIEAPSEADAGGTFKIDFLLAKVDSNLNPTSIVAVEVQTIDTTNKYSDASKFYYDGDPYPGHGQNPQPGWTKAGFNWENVSKRILPQLIYKGHALRREKLAMHGLYFILPDPVFRKILTRVGGSLLEYPKGPGTVTFHSYQLAENWAGPERPIEFVAEITTTVEQLAFAFVSPQNLPPLGVYEDTLKKRLTEMARKRKL
ncbi:NotI family restriction endonuclease [Limimaricola litoreus]|uniref:Restriction endonuclease NotI n=1 Tax=Limimaricola litoreus TaxID=2955316 RepID=A0A9X2FPX5_9RHOB|nr:hypothetical protein [Limimaricola litoreus]